MKKKYISIGLIAASGKGSRFGSEIPKQFLEVDGQIMICKTVRGFIDNPNIDEIYVTVPREYKAYCEKIFAESFTERESSKVRGIIIGGPERQDSIFEALREIEKNHGSNFYVLVHDGARPFISQGLIERVLIETIDKGAVIPVMPVTDTIRLAMDNSYEVLDRTKLLAAQTPQGFHGEIILKAYEWALNNKIKGTDDGQLAQSAGYRLYTVEGDSNNIKVTLEGDINMDRKNINEDISLPRVGMGYDVHQLIEGRKLVLGGVEIPFEKGLLGHSDADVLIHAIMDSILGACALGDIGRIFPPSEGEFKDISSLELLRRVRVLVEDNSFEIINIDATTICERPKIKSYVEEMVKNISCALCIEVGQINIKGTTTEKLGFTGREEGISAQSVCMVTKKERG